ncbi:hypothetical protein niasHT_018150 [Heterodera trifolii]|uniref:Uncharacterized protein n=1 Tax=Heterodera trifolii TaxID=157864 RepID=A0ABD2LJX2_9BILA
MSEEQWSGESSNSNESEGVHHREDPHFEQVEDQIRDIQTQADLLLFGSVFLRRPKGLAENAVVPETPSEVADLEGTTRQIAETIERIDDLEEKLKELLEHKDNAIYEDQIDEYLRELEDSRTLMTALKPMLYPDRLKDGETGKTDVSWLSWRRNTLGSKLHKESNELLALIEAAENSEQQQAEKTRNGLNTAEGLLKTADNLHQSAQYLSWFTRRVLDYNESLSEFQRDFTVNLVAQWVQEEVNKVQEHQKNCMNFCSELSAKEKGEK